MKKNFKLNIYGLGGNEGKGSIRAVMNPALKNEIFNCVKELKSYGFFTEFCKRTKTDYRTLWKYLNKHPYIPLYVLCELEKLSKADFRKHIKSLEYGTGDSKRKAKAVYNSNEDFASFVGAFIADGHLRFRETKRGKRYEFVFREEYYSNVSALAKWINNVFNINVKPKKEKNHYSIYISNKIIFRYFTNIFGFSPGRKTETVRIPGIIRESSKKIKIAVIKGILMFDGSVLRKTGQIDLLSRSKDLILDSSKIIKDLGIGLSHVSKKPDNYKRYRLTIGRQAEIKKAIIFFEKGTRKYRRLKRVQEKFINKKL
ncbi:MAG: hypothetical protein PVJ67_00025 [Candidatus Pacearchaeota archaeon]|jgi:hypothetical protein